MRPLKLVMTAFGPYAHREEIDFSTLKNKNLFLVTGPTGAGKTTIFDGISYAIYGKASSEDRDGENLRSQFSNLDTLTSVELDFELRGVHYYVKRIPKQEKKKLRGEGISIQGTDAEMKIYKEDEEKVISGVSNVNEKINEIMGINYEQFKQIMMIPQGEFRQLITSDSKEREKILQKLFGTEAFKMVENKLFDMQRELERGIEEIRNKRNENVNSIECDENEELKNLIDAKEKNVPKILEALKIHINDHMGYKKVIEKSIEKENTILENQQDKIIKSREINKKLKEKEELEQLKNNLLIKEKEVKKEGFKLNLSRKALQIKAVEENYLDRFKNVKDKSDYFDNKVLEEKNINFKIGKAEENLKLQKSKERERIKVQEKITILKGYIPKIELYEEKRDSLKIKEEQIHKTKKSKDLNEKKIENFKINIDKLLENLSRISKASTEYVRVSMELEKLNMFYNKICLLNKENLNLIVLRAEYKTWAKNLDSKKSEFEKANLEYENSFILFRKGQASILAQSLKDGECCPVCGSKHHPIPADFNEHIPSEESIKRLEINKKKVEENFRLCNDKFLQIKSEGKSQGDIVSRLKEELYASGEEEIKSLEKQNLTAFIKSRVLTLENQITNVKNQVEKFEKEKALEEETKNELEKSKIFLKEEEINFKTLNNQYTKELSNIEGDKTLLIQLEKELPEELRSKVKLDNELNFLEDKQEAMLKALKEAEENYNKVKLFYQKIVTEKEEAFKNLREAEIFLKDGEEKLKEAVKEAGFNSIEDYNKAKLTEKDIEILDKTIKDFYEELKSVIDIYNKVSKETKEFSIKDISILEEEYINIKRKIQSLNNEIKEKHALIQMNKNSFDRIKELNSQIETREKKYNIIGDLSYTARGFNEEKITFERYVLAAFFDEIIDAANIRLRKMTERYVLSRIEEKAKGKAQSGLELQVYDNYTGKHRHVKTLSGGESFKASLALALGLADVVQCYAGGINLDTMFIDEGFGTLDPESLDNAVQCLIDLQNSGRLVGIISHVPELKERIDVKLEIIPGAEGSTAKFKM